MKNWTARFYSTKHIKQGFGSLSEAVCYCYIPSNLPVDGISYERAQISIILLQIMVEAQPFIAQVVLLMSPCQEIMPPWAESLVRTPEKYQLADVWVFSDEDRWQSTGTHSQSNKKRKKTKESKHSSLEWPPSPALILIIAPIRMANGWCRRFIICNPGHAGILYPTTYYISR